MSAAAETCTWNGSNGDWSVAANWSCGHVPDTDDTAIITGGEAVVSTEETVGRVELSGGSISGNGNLTLQDGLDLSGGNFSPSSATINGLLAWTGGRLGGGREILLVGDVEASGTNTKFLGGGTYTNTATFTWTGSGNLEINLGGVFNNVEGATFDIRNDAQVVRSNGTLTFNNDGLLVKRGSNGTTALVSEFITFNNSGLVRVETGALQFHVGSGSGDGTVQVLEGATLHVSAGSLNFGAGSRLESAGTVRISGGTTLFDSVDVTSETIITGGQLGFVGQAATTNLANVDLSGGVLGGPGGLTVNGLLDWTGGTLGQPFSTTGATILRDEVQSSGANTKFFGGGTYSNTATFTWTGSGNLEINTGGVFNNLEGATFDIHNDAQLVRSNGTLTFNNDGLVVKRASNGTTAFVSEFITFNNDGLVRIETGTLQFHIGSGSGDGTVRVLEGATLHVSAGNLNFGQGSSLTSAGIVRISGGSTFFGSADVTGSTIISDGSWASWGRHPKPTSTGCSFRAAGWVVRGASPLTTCSSGLVGPWEPVAAASC